MTVLRVEDEHGVPMGMLSWFPVHGTSLHWDQHELHGDNKGHAAQVCETWGREQGYPDFVALFAQESAGDVSPNYRWSDRRGLMIGRYDDDRESTRFNGDVQARHARALFALARTEGSEVHGPLDAAIRYRDFFDRPADPRFTRTRDARTAPPRLGVAFSIGTLEGQGPFFALRSFFPWLSRLQAWNMRREAPASWRVPHGPKFPFWDFGHGKDNKVLGLLPQVNPMLFLFGADRYVGYSARGAATQDPVLETAPQRGTLGRSVSRAGPRSWARGPRVRPVPNNGRPRPAAPIAGLAVFRCGGSQRRLPDGQRSSKFGRQGHAAHVLFQRGGPECRMQDAGCRMPVTPTMRCRRSIDPTGSSCPLPV